MKTRTAKTLFALFILSLVAAGCAGSRPARVSGSREVSEIRRTPPPLPLGQEEERQDGETFRTLTTKLDEYQDLMEACERLTRTEGNMVLRDSCVMRLKALRQELLDLTDLLRIKPE